MPLVVLFAFCFVVYLIYDISKTNSQLHRKNQELKNKEAILRERIKNRDKTMEVICGHEDQQGTPINIDCGESFVPRYATCVCTTMCLADYSLIYNNLSPEDCPRWSKFEITPKEDDEE